MTFQQLVVESLESSDDYISKIYKIQEKIFKNPELLQELDKKTRSQFLERAADRDFFDVVKLIFEFKTDFASLELALIEGDLKSVESLLKNGEKLEDLKWNNRLLAMSIFYGKNQKDMLRLLLEYDLLTNIWKSKDENLLHCYARYAKNEDDDLFEIVEILVNAGVSVNEPDSRQNTPLYQSVDNENIILTSILLKKGAKADREEDFFHDTLLFLPIFYNNKNLLDLLVSNGADLDIQNEDGETALHVACSLHHEELISLLIRKGAYISPINDYDETPFFNLKPEEDNYIPSMKVMVKAFSKLIFEGIDINQSDMKSLKTNPTFREYFKKCTIELARMAATTFYTPFSYYDVLDMSESGEKLAQLTENEEFLNKFEENLPFMFSEYEGDLKIIMNEAVEIRNKSLKVKRILHLALCSLLTVQEIKKLENFILEHLTVE